MLTEPSMGSMNRLYQHGGITAITLARVIIFKAIRAHHPGRRPAWGVVPYLIFHTAIAFQLRHVCILGGYHHLPP
jgi:hypothetical protein